MILELNLIFQLFGVQHLFIYTEMEGKSNLLGAIYQVRILTSRDLAY